MQLTTRSLALAIAATALLLSGCSTFVTPRYSGSADTNMALRALGKTGISVGQISAPSDFNTRCRGAGPLGLADEVSHSEYIKLALEHELKMAGMYASGSSRITLNGTVMKLDFSSTRGLTGGTWDIELSLTSSNGRSMSASEHYEFRSGFVADTACKQTAEAFLPAVQNLILKLVKSPDFNGLIE